MRKQQKSSTVFPQEFIDKLSSSGLDPEDAEALHLTYTEDAHSIDPSYDRRAACVFTYHEVDGSQIPHNTFNRVRYTTPPTGFAAQTKWQRYSQPPGTMIYAYLPPLVDWEAIASDPNQQIYITEGELKAACACKHELPTIGLGGVSSFTAKKRGVFSVPPLMDIEWRKRRVVVIFDTDDETGLKDTVRAAAEHLMEWLLRQGAVPSLCVLPYLGDKTGLDDYIVREGVAKLQVRVLSGNLLPHESSLELLRLLNKVEYVSPLNRFVLLDALKKDLPLLTSDHLDAMLGHRQIAFPRMKSIRVGNLSEIVVQPEPLPLSKAFLAWPGSTRSEGLLYRPGEPRTILLDGNRYTNMWLGWRAEYEVPPTRAVSSQVMGEWNWVLDNVFGDDPTVREFVEDWIYYPMKHPGAKLNTFLLVVSPEGGIGKSFVGHMLAKHIYGLTSPGAAHAWMLKEGDLASSFNPYLFATSFVVGDEIAAHDKKSAYERLKSDVSEETTTINLKNQPQIRIENCANFYLSTNDMVALNITTHDRRALVHIPRKAKKDVERYRALDTLFKQGIAGPVLLHYAREHYVQSKNFDPKSEAPRTSSREQLVLNTQNHLHTWMLDLYATCDRLTRKYATSEELKALYEEENPDAMGRYTVDSFGRAASNARMVRLFGGAQVSVTVGNSRLPRRYWALDGVDLAAGPDVREVFVEKYATVPFRRLADNVKKVIPIKGGRKF